MAYTELSDYSSAAKTRALDILSRGQVLCGLFGFGVGAKLVDLFDLAGLLYLVLPLLGFLIGICISMQQYGVPLYRYTWYRLSFRLERTLRRGRGVFPMPPQEATEEPHDYVVRDRDGTVLVKVWTPEG
jgi:hypothetical protein